MKIGAAIKIIRKRKFLTQGELATISGITQTALSQIETGATTPNQNTVQALCESLQVPVPLVYLLCMESTDIPKDRQIIYDALYPSFKNLALELIGTDHSKTINNK